MHQDTLRDRFARTIARAPTPGGWQQGLAETLCRSPTVEVSEAYEYLWDATPDDKVLSYRDFPNVALGPRLLRALGTGEGNPTVFLEGTAPASGLAAGFLLDRAGTIAADVSAVDLVAAAADKAQRPAMIVPPEDGVGLAFLEDALASRAGALVYAHDPPFAAMEDFYAQNGVREPAELLQVLHLTFFHEFDQRFGRRIVPPQMVCYVPVARDQTVRPVGPGDELIMLAPAHAGIPEDMQDTIAGALRPSVLNALFALSCLNATSSPGGGASHEHLPDRVAGPAPRLVLALEGLRRCLDEAGRAPELGIGHAMTVCRDLFGGQVE